MPGEPEGRPAPQSGLAAPHRGPTPGSRASDLPPWVAPVAVVGAAGVVAYVAAWATAGVWYTDYDPVRQAISELFARGAPPGPARLVRGSLVVTGVLLVPFAAALDRGLPGRGRAGPVAAGLAGVMTVLVGVFPCSEGCPGPGTSLTDALHGITAGIGYGALVAAPILSGFRLRGRADRFAAVSLVLGGLAAGGFLAHATGLVEEAGGLLQRIFNTTADLWYLLAAGVLVRRARSAGGGDH